MALAGPGAPGSHAGLETRLFLGHQAASDLNQEPLEAGPEAPDSGQRANQRLRNTAQLQPGALVTGLHPRLCMRAQLCLTLHDPTDCSLPGSSVRGILDRKSVV